MDVARHGSGPVATLRAFASQVHPVFMLPPLAAGLFGAVLAGRSPTPTGRFSVLAAGLHTAALFFAVYTAHVKDGYVDFHVREEDEDHPLTEAGCRLGLAGATFGFAGCLAGLWWVAGPWTAAITLPTWLVGYHHAPQLDGNPVTATCGYPAGVALALLGGYHAQVGGLGPAPLALAAVFLVLLSGVKVVDDATDYAYDRSIEKRTVAVVLGPRRARTLASALLAIPLLAVVPLALVGPLPPGAALAVVPFAAVALVARRADPELATMLLVRGAYVFLAVLVAAVWFRPLA